MDGRASTYVGLLQVGLVDNSLSDTRVLENVLTEIRVELEDVVGGMTLLARGSARVRVALGHTAAVVLSR
jgi:hypothetical protein